MRSGWLTAAAAMLCATVCLAEPAKFAAGPTATRDGNRVVIRFAVTAAADVEVAVLDADGAVVRHLAAGVLGPNAPAPLKPDSLAQELVWDGKDDAGLDRLSDQAKGGPLRVRVRVGSSPRLDRIAGWDGNTLGGRIEGLAVGAAGEVFVLLSDSYRGRSEVRVLGRDGRYARTIMPYSADTPPERTESVGHLMIEGERVPIVFSGLGHTLSPLVSGLKTQTMAVHPKGHLVLASAVGTMAEHHPPRHLLALDARGGAPDGVNFVGPRFRRGRDRMLGGAGEGGTAWLDHVAVSPDGQWVYLTVSSSSSFYKQRHGVWRARWDDAEIEALWLGADGPGDDDARFDDPQGLATDLAGRLYVADRGNNRVMVFSPDGKLVGKIAVESPEQIAVHPRTGQIYLVSRRKPKDRREQVPSTLVKLAAFAPGQGPPKELARLAGQAIGLMALDPTGEQARLWLAVGRNLLPVDDRGERFETGQPVGNNNGLVYPMFIAGDPERNRALLYQGNQVVETLDLETGRTARFARGTDVALDRAGNVYVMDGYNTNSISRYDPDGRPLPFSGVGSHTIKSGNYRGFGPNLGMRGLAVAPNGDIYQFRTNNYGGPGVYGGRIDVYGPDGTLKKANLIDGLGYGDCGLGVDAAGNVYVGVNVKPADEPFPPEFLGKLPEAGWTWWEGPRQPTARPVPWRYTFYHPYLFNQGSVFKFGPQGGAFYGQHPWLLARKDYEPTDTDRLEKAPPDAVSYRSSYLSYEIKAAGAKWRYPGCGIIPSSGDGLKPDPGCVCYVSHLGVDPYGRVFAPNVFRFSVEMVDTGGNRIARIGRYGNADSAGPDIRFAWPAHVSVGGGKVFVSDSVNRRVSVIGFEYSAEAACPVR